MSKQPGRQPNSTIVLRLWTYPEAVNALPYFRAIAQSLRESWLEMLRVRRQVRRMDARRGRPDRQALILRAEAARQVERAEGHLDEALHELNALDVSCLDPVRGLALIPFRQGENLAWFVFDLFAPKGLVAWQFDADPTDTRRPMVEPLDPALGPNPSIAAIDLLMSRGARGANGWSANLGETRG